MSILDSIFGGTSLGNGNPQLGICNGNMPGNIGVWVAWKAPQTECFRIVINCCSRQTFTFTFEQSFQESFWVSIETPYEVREWLRGKNRIQEGSITFEAVLSDRQGISQTFSLEEVTKAMHGKGSRPPVKESKKGAIPLDTPELNQLSEGQLKGRSDQNRQAAQEKARKLEEERKAKELAAQEAAKKAADAAKAAATKPAAGGGAPAQGGMPPGRVALVYGTTTGNTGQIAESIKSELGAAINNVKLITELAPQDLTVPEILILGVPTWHIGEMQDDWAAFLPQLESANPNFSGKKIAIFGLGDGKGYPETYVDAMAELSEKFEKRGAKLVGLWPTAGYEYQKSKAIRDGKFLGLVIDVENQHNLSDERVKGWCTLLRGELGL